MKLIFLAIFAFAATAENLDQEAYIRIVRQELNEKVDNLKANSPGADWDDPAARMDTLQLIEAQGYPASEHDVITEDGFILAIHRIDAPRFKQPIPEGEKRGPAVFLQHGLEASSACFVNDLFNESLAFILADAGYDVWLGNVRGNTYSRRHVSYDPNSKEFWQWTFDEMAEYDVPAMINYVTKTTGYDKVYYVGHSQGTLVGFIQFSSDQKFAEEKIRAFFALAPVATVGHLSSKIKQIAPYTNKIDTFLQLVGYYDFLPDNPLMHWLQDTACPPDEINNALKKLECRNLYNMLIGTGSEFQNASRATVRLSHFPAGTSSHNVAHFGQMVNSNKFQKYNWGYLMNRIKYRSYNPPEYDLTKLQIPTALYSGGKDTLADPDDVAWLRTQIKSTIIDDTFIPEYVHGDFIFALNANDKVYDRILELMKKY